MNVAEPELLKITFQEWDDCVNLKIGQIKASVLEHVLHLIFLHLHVDILKFFESPKLIKMINPIDFRVILIVKSWVKSDHTK